MGLHSLQRRSGTGGALSTNPRPPFSDCLCFTFPSSFVQIVSLYLQKGSLPSASLPAASLQIRPKAASEPLRHLAFPLPPRRRDLFHVACDQGRHASSRLKRIAVAPLLPQFWAKRARSSRSTSRYPHLCQGCGCTACLWGCSSARVLRDALETCHRSPGRRRSLMVGCLPDERLI